MKFFYRIFKIIVAVAVIILIADVMLVFGMAHYRPPIQKADAVIVLGAAINTPALYNRTVEGLGLYNAGNAGVMVLSGGKIAEADISEAQYMEKVIKKNSPRLPKYILEDQSHTTYENIKNSQAKLDKSGSVIIVSDQFHLARSVLTAYRAGFKPVYWSAPKPDYYTNKELRYYYIRELVAMISYIPHFIKG